MPCPFQIAQVVGNIGQFYPIGSGYGWRVHPVEGTKLFHFGVDVPALAGTNVRAALPGTVLRQGRGDRSGNYIVLIHDGGYLTKYMHLQNIFTNKGDTVRAGDVIGSVGSTGSATGPHLHFQIHDPDGDTFDPTDCYNNSVFVAPYDIPPQEEDQKKPLWPYFVAGGSLLLLGWGIYEYTKDEKR